MQLASSICRWGACAAALSLQLALPSVATAADPFASNNGIYPAPSSWAQPYRTANFAYPQQDGPSAWLKATSGQPLSTATAPAYVMALKRHLEPSLRKMIEAPEAWSPAANGWYDMPWVAQGDAENGREPILGSFTGQIVLKRTFAASGLKVDLQNHTVIYYDATAAGTLRKLWANPMRPDRSGVNFAEGAIIVKAGAVSPTPAEWPVVEGAATWTVFRPPVSQVVAHNQGKAVTWKPELTPLRALQFDIIVKDKVASPQTGWVFITYIHDKSAPGRGAWDKLVPLGAMWGNDPDFARQPDGRDPQGGPLRETWINPDAPRYGLATLGWGGRLSGPIDVSERHNVVLTNGKVLKTTRASSCLSCHGTAQSPFISNLYPSPNRAFPPDGSPFPMFEPGSAQWAKWFANRSGQQPMDAHVGSVGLDYDMLVMFALSNVEAATGNAPPALPRLKAH